MLLSRQTLSNWVIACAEGFTPIYEHLKDSLLKTTYIQADETTVQVIKEDGKDAKSKKYMWLYKTGTAKHPIILYDYQKTRSSACPRDFLEDFEGHLQIDGYSGYGKVTGVTRIACLAHIRRKFYDIIKDLDDEGLK